MTDLYDLDLDGLTAQLRAWGQPAFRTKQLWEWLYEHRVASFDEMTNLPKALRDRLVAEARLGTLQVVTEQVSRDGTRKRLYRLEDDRRIESVLMPYADGRRTACISSQAGCAMGCVFCATGQQGFGRHLAAAEIVEQATRFAVELHAVGERLSNVVLMGMGEPLHNLDAVIEAIHRMHDRLGISHRRISVSTVGLVPGIERLAAEALPITLAISLHAADNATRDALLPVNKRWPLRALIAACRAYVDATGRRVSFEWALIAGQNDDEATADRLAALLRGLICHVNLIPLNPTQGYGGEATSDPRAHAFADALQARGIAATVRMRRGIDIDAGCGQLASREAER